MAVRIGHQPADSVIYGTTTDGDGEYPCFDDRFGKTERRGNSPRSNRVALMEFAFRQQHRPTLPQCGRCQSSDIGPIHRGDNGIKVEIGKVSPREQCDSGRRRGGGKGCAGLRSNS